MYPIDGSEQLYLYKLTQVVLHGYDTYDSMIVCAESEAEAKDYHPNGNRFSDFTGSASYTWPLEPKLIACELIGIAHKISKGVVLASFNAG